MKGAEAAAGPDVSERSDSARPVDPVGGAHRRPLVLLFAGTTFTGAFLLFWIQPLFTKAVLPLLGGSPGVWNTALVFFQGTLLAGYLYVHLTSRHLSRRTQVLVHLGLLLAAFVSLPIAVAEGWAPPASSVPMAWLLALLAVSIGLPFLAVSATAPLVQRWFADTGHPDGDDPYFLYAASNFGSLVALLAFPVLLEPFAGLARQGRMWTAGYAGLVLLIGVCAAVVWRRGGRADAPASPIRSTPLGGGVPDWRRKLAWVLLAFVPSSLLLGVTSHISTDLASFPLLWIGPLVLYLLTYILAFARRPPIPHEWMLELQPYLLIFLVLSLTWEAAQRLLVLNLVLHLAAFFVIALVCHRELVELRPGADRLTEFYLWLSLGGVLGGAFTALAAPVLFDSVLEYPLMVVAAAVLRPAAGEERPNLDDLVRPAAVGGVALLLLLAVRSAGVSFELAGPLVLFGLVALIVFGFTGRPLRFGLGLAALFLVGFQAFETAPVLARERSFFGVHRVAETGPEPYHLLFHGTTLHGMQDMRPGRRERHSLYYARIGPLGQLIEGLERHDAPDRIAVIGLGSGDMACYGRPGQSWTFYEIDPTVERIARDTALFRYLEACGEGVEVVIGDGRLSLERVPDGTYDLLVVDAFSSDAIPVHLLTVEALRLYVAKLAPGGSLVLHISNRHMNLRPVVANGAAAVGLAGRYQFFSIGRRDEAAEPAASRVEPVYDRAASSTWAVLARDPSDLSFLDDAAWPRLEPDSSFGTWTDDFSNIVEVLDI